MTKNEGRLAQAEEHQRAGRLQEAGQLCRAILRGDPRDVAALHLLGVIVFQTGRPDLAVEHVRKALRLKGSYAEAHNSLGTILANQGKWDEAIAAYRSALRARPGYWEAHNNLGEALEEQGEAAAAAEAYREAIRLLPSHPVPHCNLGTTLKKLGMRQEAMASYREAIRLGPDLAAAHNNLGTVLRELGRPEDGAAACREAIRLSPEFAEAHGTLSLIYLQMGNYEQGWSEYEWRWRCKNFNMRPLRTSRPMWNGTDLEGRTIFVYAEQGLGDTLQFIRYASLVKGRGGRVVVACQEPLVRLLEGCAGIDQVVVKHSEVPPFDVHVPLMSLPRIFGTTVATVPAAVPYLHADPTLVDTWRRELSSSDAFKIGIIWSSAPDHPGREERPIPLKHFAALGRVPGVEFFSLQKHHGLDQLRDVAGILPVRDLSSRLDVAAGPFMDTAAVMKSLDLVISADTAVAHLAGGLGVPVWVGLPFALDWRWIIGREDSPWYPTMRLFQQREPGNWDEVFERMACALARRASESGQNPSLARRANDGEA